MRSEEIPILDKYDDKISNNIMPAKNGEDDILIPQIDLQSNIQQQKPKMLQKLWSSPTLMTWLSYSTKSLTIFGVLPLVLKQFSTGDIVIWSLFSTIISLQSVADFGFRQTFSRIISYAFGGANNIGIFAVSNHLQHSDEPNIPLLREVVSTMRYIYVRLTFIMLALMISLGSWSMEKPLQGSSDIQQAWISWIIILVVSSLSFYTKIYQNFIEGLNEIALARKVETLTSTGSIVTSILILSISPSLLNLVISNQFWLVIVGIRDWYLCRKIKNGIYKDVSLKLPFNRDIFQQIWQPAWRTGISGIMSAGLTNATGLFYAQVGSTTSVASYLLALRIITQIKEVSMAPFYSKLPVLAILRVKNDMDKFKKVIQRGMFLSNMTFIICFVVTGLFSDSLLSWIGSNVAYVNQTVWILLGLAFFIHRYGAMHLQVYLSTNHIISHIVDGITGIIYIVSCILLIDRIGIYAMPISMILGYLGFYAWFSAKYSYKSINVKFWNFETQTSALPLLILIFYSIYSVVL